MCRIMEDFAKEERTEAKAERDIETATKLLESGDMTEAMKRQRNLGSDGCKPTKCSTGAF